MVTAKGQNGSRHRATWPLRHTRLGMVPVFAGSASDALEACIDRLESGAGARIATANLDFLAVARRDPDARALLESSHLVVADGTPVAWFAGLKSRCRAERLAGVDFVDRLLAWANRPLNLAMYGGEQAVSRRAAAALAARHPHITITTRLTPPFRALYEDEVAVERECIRSAKPDIVLVALGFPRQERLIADYFDCAPQALWLGIGGTFDFIAGRRRRAPGWIQRAGLEWTIRLVQEPRRLWKRYLVRDLPEAARLAVECLAARVRPQGHQQHLN